jgi:hypothetical protein
MPRTDLDQRPSLADTRQYRVSRYSQQFKVPDPELERLEVFAGSWTTEGELGPGAEQGPDSPQAGTPVTGTDSYEWVPGRFFMLHRWNWKIGETSFEGMSVIGYDPETSAFPMHNFDNLGYSRMYQASVTDRTWTYLGVSERAVVVVGEDGNSITYRWERRENGNDWLPLCEVRTARVG